MNTFSCTCHYCGSEIIRKRQSVPVKLHFCNIECKSQHQRSAKPVSEQWLREHYTDKGMDTTRIAHIVKRDPKSVWNWLKDFGIATRKRGHASTHKFPKGYKSMLGKKHTAETRKRLSDIAKADGRVPYDPAIGSYMKGRSGASTPNWKGGITPQRQSVYSSTEWAACVKAVWKRENATCERCGIRKNEAGKTPFDIHHIVGFECVELRTVASNLALLCEPCHYWVHSRKNTRGAFIKRNLAKIERENATGELIPHTVEE